MTDTEKLAAEFLMNTGATISIEKAVPQKQPLWAKKDENHGINYWIVIKMDKNEYGFDFWGSIVDKEKNRKPTEASILSCLIPCGSETFEDFCDEFGCDSDSMNAFKSFQAQKKQDDAVRKLFTSDEIESLIEFI